MTKDEALKMALECIEAWDRGCDRDAYWRDIEKATEAIKASLTQPEQEPWLLESTQTLAKNLARKFYPEVTQWECLDDLAGVISQIDNMTTGLMRKTEQEPVASMGVKTSKAQISYSYSPEHGGFALPDGTYKLYTSPPQRQPLRGEQIYELFVKTLPKLTLGMTYVPEWAIPIARAIEAAHGIGNKT